MNLFTNKKNKKMKEIKQLGIWMDHSNAFLMELNNGNIVQNNVVCEYSHHESGNSFNDNETITYNKEQRSSYYKKLGDVIRNNQEVVLFGPTDAKNELLNLLKANHLFENIKIDVISSDKMSANQMHTFVKAYFK
jgi:stalled ribosome rescue protein Dom34